MSRPIGKPVSWRRDLMWIAVAGLLSLLPFLGQTRDLASREVRHAQIAREMAASGDFVVPTVLGREYPDKPPVMHAAVAMIYKIAGRHSMGLARLPSVVAAILGAMALYGIGLALDGRRTGLVAAFGLLGVAGYAHMARVARPDMIYTAAILVSCFGFVRGLRRLPRRQPLWIALAGFGCAVATVSKGPLGLIFPLMFAGLAPVRRLDLRWPRRSEWALFAAVVMATAAVWVVPAYMHDDGAYLKSVITQPDLDLDPETRGHPFWWYLPQIVGGFLPLTLLLPLVAMDLRERRYLAAVLMATAMVVVLSCLTKKRVHYLLPVYPFLALAAAEAVHRFSERLAMLRWAQGLIALSLVGGPVYYGLIQPRLQPGEDPQFEYARKVLQCVGPEGRVLCYGTVGEAVAFLAEKQTVTPWATTGDLQNALRQAGSPAWVALPDEAIGELAKAINADARPQDAFPDEVADGRKLNRLHLYRVTHNLR
ncbi:MAG: glycosyltransferase family 39 protein [Verrucomicrobia bacterium]|nr:glycosyltransferase family 39 protein [Verrucomicrobiota bacterium]